MIIPSGNASPLDDGRNANAEYFLPPLDDG